MQKNKYYLFYITICLAIGFTTAFNSNAVINNTINLTNSLTKASLILPPSATITGSASVCLNESPEPEITFTGSAGTIPYTFTYTLNGGANQTISTVGSDTSVSLSVSTAVAGDFVYELVSVSDGVNDTATASGSVTVTVSSPIIDFAFNNEACSGTPVDFSSSVTGNGPFIYSWTFGDGGSSANANPTHIYNPVGCGFLDYTATLTVIDSNGCTNTISKIVSVARKPNVSFEDLDSSFDPPFDNCGNTNPDASYTINVGNSSTSDSCIINYDVDWGDGTSETNVSFPASHTYVELGSFDMTITGYSDTGCSNSETILIRNSSNPTGAIETPGNTVNRCLPMDEIEFAIGSWGDNPSDTSYYIDYGDGTIENYTQAELESSIYYNAADPAASDNFPIPHAYTESNCPQPNYTLYLSISTSCGESNLWAGPIIILQRPTVDFTMETPGCVNNVVQFENLTEGGYNQNCNTDSLFYWDFGDGTTSEEENPSHIYTTPGNYTVSLYAENYCGITETEYRSICIEPELIAEFTLDNTEGCEPFEVQAINTTDLSESCGGETYLWEVEYAADFCGTTESWSFINGTSETSVNPYFRFDLAGSYQITQTITNTCGSFQSTQEIEVKQPPTATLNPISDYCGTATINPLATVNTCVSNSDTVSYSWLFTGGTPATSNQLNPGSISYNSVGNYTVTFSVTNACGTTTVSEDFSVNDSPTITNTDLSQSICSGTVTNAIELTSDNSNTTYNWSANNPPGLSGYIANGTSATIPAQTLINNTSSAIVLIYTVTPEIGGCLGTAVDFEITVEPAALITTQPVSAAVCQNGSADDLFVDFQGTGTPSYQWYQNSVDDNTSGTAIIGATGATYAPQTNTIGFNYYYVIITFTTGGCNEIVSETAEIEVANNTQIDTQPLDTQTICEGGIISALIIEISGGAGEPSYQWYSNTINSNTGGTPISGATESSYTPPVFNTNGTFYFYVDVSFIASGCSGLTSEVSEVVVVDDPVVSSQPIAFQSLCQNSNVENLEVTIENGLGTASYQWYVNSVNNTTTGSVVLGATSNLFTPPSDTVGTSYYYCIVTQDVSGCEVTSAVSEVEITAGAQFNAQPISNELCLGETTSALEVSYNNGTGNPAYQWYQNTIDDTTTGTAIAGATTDTYNPDVTSVGTFYYYIIITFDSGGCSEIISNTAEITVNNTPIISGTSLIICSGNSFEYIPDETSGDTVPANTMYTWSSPNISPAGSVTGATEQLSPTTTISQILENTTTNTAIVTYIVTPVSGNCIGDDFEIEVTVNPAISILATVSDSSCYEVDNGSIELNISGGVPFTTGNPYNITWSGPNGFVSNNEDISNLEPGTYTLNIEDDGGCPYTEEFTITEPEELIFSVIDFNPETITCFGANDGQINIDIYGGSLPYSYSWTLDGTPYSSDEDLANLGPGEYSVSITDTNNCGPIFQTFVIEEPEILEVDLISQTDVVCFGESTGSITIDISGGRPDYSFEWLGPDGYTSTSQNIDNLYAGTYNLTVSDSSGCTDTLEVEIIENNQISIEVTTTEIICYGDNNASITIDIITGGVSPYDITWSNFGTGYSQTNLSAGIYIITITDAENCQREFPIEIEEAPIFLINPEVTQMSCSGENDASIALNLVGGINPVTVVWDDDASAGTERNNIPPGTYNVTITDGTPCTIEESFTIYNIDPLALSANITHALDCDDTNSGAINLLIEGGTLPFAVVWSNGTSTEDLENIAPNTYVANVTDANGCEIQGSWEITRFEPLELFVDTQMEIDCETKSFSQMFEAMASGGVPPFQYNWSSGTVSGTNNEFMTTDEDGLVLLEAVDSQGCSTNYTFNVESPVFGEPDFTTTSYGYVNYGIYATHDPIEFINESTGMYESILWNFGDGSFSSEENPVHTYTAIGNYLVTLTVNYPHGCVYIKEILLNIELGYKLIMPDAFTPNEDGINDYFAPVFVGLNTLEMNVFDTWGSLIYAESGDSIRGWDGKVNEELAENGNYYFTFSAKTFYGEEINKQGAFVFIK